jgi:hypothetical protein
LIKDGERDDRSKANDIHAHDFELGFNRIAHDVYHVFW